MNTDYEIEEIGTDSSESKNEKFRRLATARTNKTIDMIRKLGNLSNQSFYEYSNEEVEKIFNAIEKELRNAKSKFVIKEDEDNGTFSL